MRYCLDKLIYLFNDMLPLGSANRRFHAVITITGEFVRTLVCMYSVSEHYTQDLSGRTYHG